MSQNQNEIYNYWSNQISKLHSSDIKIKKRINELQRKLICAAFLNEDVIQQEIQNLIFDIQEKIFQNNIQNTR